MGNPGIQHTLTAVASALCKRLFRRLWERGWCFNIFKAFEIIFVGGIFFGEQIGGADLLMVGVAVMFGELISLVENAFSPVDDKLVLMSTVANPIKLHVNCFGSFLLDGVVDDARGSSSERQNMY
jgi:hypothetical protein